MVFHEAVIRVVTYVKTLHLGDSLQCYVTIQRHNTRHLNLKNKHPSF